MAHVSEVDWVKIAEGLDIETFPNGLPSLERDVHYPAPDSEVQFVLDRYINHSSVEGPLTLGALAYIGMRAESQIEVEAMRRIKGRPSNG